MQEPLELRVGVGPLLGAGARRIRHEMVLGAGAEPGHVPGTPAREDAVDARLPAFGERDHPLEGVRGQDLAEGRPCRRQRERVAGQRPADPADVGILDGDRRRATRAATSGLKP